VPVLLGDVPAPRLGNPPGLRLRVDRPDGFARTAEGRVRRVDLDLGQQDGASAPGGQQVAQLLLDQVADHPLGLGAQDVQGVGTCAPALRALQRQQSDLGPVAVGDDQLMRHGEGRQGRGGDADIASLILCGEGLAPA